MITEDYVSFETAKLLREKGFNEPTLAYAYGQDMVSYYSQPKVTNSFNIEAGRYPLPTLQMAMKWLREMHNICITIYPDKEKGYEAVPYNIKDDVEILLQSFGIYGNHIFRDSYEQACETALSYCLENLI